MAKVNLGFEVMRVEIRQKNNPAEEPAGQALVMAVSRSSCGGSAGPHFFSFRM
jgi:hypothetical protein